jgi:hypothetical protein
LWQASDEDFKIFPRAINDVDLSIKYIWSMLSPLAISWIYELRFQQVQSSTKSTASLTMHMPFFNMARFMSAIHIQHG